MTTEKKNVLGYVISAGCIIIAIVTTIFYSGGFYNETKATSKGLPELTLKVESNYKENESSHAEINKRMSIVEIETKVLKQEFEDFKEVNEKKERVKSASEIRFRNKAIEAVQEIQ